MKTLLFQAAAAAMLCLAACSPAGHAVSAAEHGLRQDLMAVGEVVNFRETGTEKLQAAEGEAVLLRFESEVKWLTLDEAIARSGGPGDTQEYFGKAQYVSEKLGAGPKAGRVEVIKGAALMARTDTGWIYKGLADN